MGSTIDCHPVTYDFNLLALTWPSEFCGSGKCVSNWQSLWDGKSMTVHGFWPSSSDRTYLACQKSNGGSYDPYCYHPYQFDFSVFSQAEQETIAQTWPELGASGNLWEHEWEKHGTCYLHITEDIEHSSMAEQDIFRTFFLGAVAKAKNMNIKLTPGSVDSKDALAAMIGLKSSEFEAICASGHSLSEIRVCYQITNEPGRESITDCPTFSQQCSFPVTIRD